MPTHVHHPTENLRLLLQYLYRTPAPGTKADIAKAIGLTEDQVKHSLKALKNKKWISEGFTVDPSALGYHYRYRVDIWVIPKQLKDNTGGMPGDIGVKTQQDLAKYILGRLPTKPQFISRILVEDVRILLGSPADLSATIHATSIDSMLHFVTDGLRMCGAVSQTSSFLEGWSAKARLRDDSARSHAKDAD